MPDSFDDATRRIRAIRDATPSIRSTKSDVARLEEGIRSELTAPIRFTGLPGTQEAEFGGEPGPAGTAGQIIGGILPFWATEAALGRMFSVLRGPALANRLLRGAATGATLAAGAHPPDEDVDALEVTKSALASAVLLSVVSPEAGPLRSAFGGALSTAVPMALGQDVGIKQIGTNAGIAGLLSLVGRPVHTEAPKVDDLTPISEMRTPPSPTEQVPLPSHPATANRAPETITAEAERQMGLPFGRTPSSGSSIPIDVIHPPPSLGGEPFAVPESVLPTRREVIQPEDVPRPPDTGRVYTRGDLETHASEAARQDALLGRSPVEPTGAVRIDLGSGYGEEIRAGHIGLEQTNEIPAGEGRPPGVDRRMPQILHDMSTGRLPFEKESVDSFNISQSLRPLGVRERGAIFNEIHRTLRPGGVVTAEEDPDVIKAMMDQAEKRSYEVLDRSPAGDDVEDRAQIAVTLRKPIATLARELANVSQEERRKPAIKVTRSVDEVAAIGRIIKKRFPTVSQKARNPIVAMKLETEARFRQLPADEVPGFDQATGALDKRGLTFDQVTKIRDLARQFGDDDLATEFEKIRHTLEARRTMLTTKRPRAPRVTYADNVPLDNVIADQEHRKLLDDPDVEMEPIVKARLEAERPRLTGGHTDMPFTTLAEMRAPNVKAGRSYRDIIAGLKANKIVPTDMVDGKMRLIYPDGSVKMVSLDEASDMLARMVPDTKDVPVYQGSEAPPKPAPSTPFHQQLEEPFGDRPRDPRPPDAVPEATTGVMLATPDVVATHDALPPHRQLDYVKGEGERKLIDVTAVPENIVVTRRGEPDRARGGILYHEGELGRPGEITARVRGRALELPENVELPDDVPLTQDEQSSIYDYLKQTRPIELAQIYPTGRDWSSEDARFRAEHAMNRLFADELKKSGYDFARFDGQPRVIFQPSPVVGPGIGEGPGARPIEYQPPLPGAKIKEVIVTDNHVTGERKVHRTTRDALNEIVSSKVGDAPAYTEDEFRSLFRRRFANAKNNAERANIREKYTLYKAYFPRAVETLRPGETRLRSLDGVLDKDTPPILNLTPPGAPPINQPPGIHPGPLSADNNPPSGLYNVRTLQGFTYSKFFREAKHWSLDLENKTGIPAWSRIFEPNMRQHNAMVEFNAKFERGLQRVEAPLLNDPTAGERISHFIESGFSPEAARQYNIGPRERAAAEWLHTAWDELWGPNGYRFVDEAGKNLKGVDYVQNYVPVRRIKTDPEAKAYIRSRGLSDKLYNFYAEMPREGGGSIDYRQMDAFKLFREHLYMGSKKFFMKDTILAADKAIRGLKLDPKNEPFRKALLSQLDHLRGVPDETVTMLNHFIRDVGKKLGHDISEEDSGKLLSGFLRLSAGAHIAWRVPILVKHLQNLMLNIPLMGVKSTFDGVKKALTKQGFMDAVKAGVPTGEAFAYSDEILAARDPITSVVRTGTQPYSKFITFMRVASYHGMHDKVMEAGVKLLRSGSVADFERDTELLSAFHPVEAKSILDAARSGRIDKAAEMAGRLMQENTNWIYATANAPEMYHGALGRLFGQFGMWSSGYVEYARNIFRYGTPRERTRKLTRFLAVNAVMGEGAKLLGANIWSWLMFGPVVFTGGPGIGLVQDAGAIARGLAEGDTDNDQFNQALKRLQYQVPSSLVPGAAALRDVTRAHQALVERGPRAAVSTIMTGRIPDIGDEPVKPVPPGPPPSGDDFDATIRRLRQGRRPPT